MLTSVKLYFKKLTKLRIGIILIVLRYVIKDQNFGKELFLQLVIQQSKIY